MRLSIIITSLLVSIFSFGNGLPTENSKVKLPKQLVCYLSKSASKTPHVLYTRLEKVSELPTGDKSIVVWDQDSKESPKKDEVAYDWTGAYYTSTISANEYVLSLWTCDTEDRDYVFKTADLVLDSASSVTTKKVSGELTVSVRTDSETFSIECDANY